MRWWTKLRLRLRSVVRGEALDRELDAELRFHLEEQIAEYAASGMSREDARLAALRTMGGSVVWVAEQCRDARRMRVVDAVLQDVRFAGRMLAKNRGFTIVAVLTLAIGVGFNTLAFSVTRTLLFGRLPVADPDRLVLGEALREGFDAAGTSLVQYTALRRQSDVFASTAISIERRLLLRDGADAEQLEGAAVSPGFLETLGSAPVVGRRFTPGESRAGGPPVVLLSYGLWQRRFAADPHIVGRPVTLDGRPYTVVGIMPQAFDYPTRTDAWIALDVDPDSAPPSLRASHSYIFVARLRAGVSRVQAADAVRWLAARVQAQFPETERGWSYGLLTMRQWSIGDDDGRVTRAVVVLLAAIGFLLVLCCVNVANLLMVRGVVRERELATRIALGASRWRIGQQLLTEGAVLSLLGGTAGLVLAWTIRPLFLALNPIQPHAFADVVNAFRIDSRVVVFCLATSMASGIVFTLLPALRVACVPSPIAVLRQADRRTRGSGSGRPWLRALVVAELAAALSLSFGGALLTKSFLQLGRLDLGYRPEHLLTLRLPLSAADYPRSSEKIAFFERLVQRIRAIPRVEAAGLTSALPMQEFSPDSVFTVEGRPSRNPADVPIAAMRYVSVGYPETLGLTLLEGRLFTDDDRADSRKVAVITEEFARQAFGAADPIGSRIRLGREHDTGNPWFVVVGVAKDTKEDRLNFRVARPVLYIPYVQRTTTPARLEMALVVRAAADPTPIANAVRAAIHELSPSQPIADLSTMDAMLTSVLSTDRFSARMMMLLASAGLLLAGVGLYSVLAYAVSQRTAEIGLRMALGAQPSNIVVLIAREAALIVGLGFAISLPAMAACARLLSGVLFSVSSFDPAVVLALMLLIAAVVSLACAVPVRRVMRLDPARALHLG